MFIIIGGLVILFLLLLMASAVGTLIYYLAPGKSQEKSWWKSIFFTLVGMIAILGIVSLCTTPMNVQAKDIYGSYVIDRSIFPGPDALWQYEKYSFKINKKNELVFRENRSDGQTVQCRIKVEILTQYVNDRLKLSDAYTCHHVVSSSPTMYRSPWSFTYVFESPVYGNMFFRKVRWYEFWLR